MTELFFNFFSIESAQAKWNQVYSSKLEKAKDIARALKYDLFVRNPYRLIVGNTKDVILNDSASKIKKVAACIIVMLTYTYMAMLCGFFIYSIGNSIQVIATFSKSSQIASIASHVKEIGSRVLMLASAPTKYLFYKIPKEVIERSPLFVGSAIHKVCRVKSVVFNNILIPLFQLIKKVLFWNCLQLVLVVRSVFDSTYEMCDWTFDNVAFPFWKEQIEPKVGQFKKTIRSVKLPFMC